MIALSPGFLSGGDIGPATIAPCNHSTNQTESANHIQRLVRQTGAAAGGFTLLNARYIRWVAFLVNVHRILLFKVLQKSFNR
jgi:hypothetical protein